MDSFSSSPSSSDPDIARLHSDEAKKRIERIRSSMYPTIVDPGEVKEQTP